MELKEIVNRICDGLVSVDGKHKSKTVLIQRLQIMVTTSRALDVWASISLETKSSIGGIAILQMQRWIEKSNIQKMADGNVM